MGICFVGKKRAPGNRGFQQFIADYIPARPGNFVDIDTGQVQCCGSPSKWVRLITLMRIRIRIFI
jgi:hypothetical protein